MWTTRQPPVSNWFKMNETGVPGEFTEHPYYQIADFSDGLTFGNSGCYLPVLPTGAVLSQSQGNQSNPQVPQAAIEPFAAQGCPCASFPFYRTRGVQNGFQKN